MLRPQFVDGGKEFQANIAHLSNRHGFVDTLTPYQFIHPQQDSRSYEGSKNKPKPAAFKIAAERSGVQGLWARQRSFTPTLLNLRC